MSVPRHIHPLEQFQFEMLCISNHTACRFAKKRDFSARFGQAALGRRLARFTFSKGKTLQEDTTKKPLPESSGFFASSAGAGHSVRDA